MRRIFIAIALSVLLIQEATAQKNTSAMSRHYGHGIPPLSPLKDLDNKAFNIPAPRDHWTVLYFWADWCVPCIRRAFQSSLPLSGPTRRYFQAYKLLLYGLTAKKKLVTGIYSNRPQNIWKTRSGMDRCRFLLCTTLVRK